MLALGDRVDRSKLLGGEAYGHDLHRLGATAGPTTSAALHLLDVVAGLGLVSPLSDLLLTHHEQNRMTKNLWAEALARAPSLAYRPGEAVPGGVELRSMPEPTTHGGAAGPTPFRRCAMSALLVGYARCSTDQQDLTAQRDGLLGLGVEAERIYVDHGLTGTNRERPGLREALAACRPGTPWW